VALTDIHDSAVQQVLAGLEEGQYCRAAVLGPDPACSSQTGSSGKASAKASGKGGGKGGKGKGGKGKGGNGKGGKGGKDSSKDSGADNSSQLLLSLRPAAGGQCAAHAAAAAAEQQEVAGLAPGQLQPKSLKPGQKVAGYVKSAGQAGVFVCLARNLDARIRWVTGLVGHSC
jgi:hypothetical protein